MALSTVLTHTEHFPISRVNPIPVSSDVAACCDYDTRKSFSTAALSM